MSLGFGLIGNGRVLARVQADGALTDAFFPSIGFYRHIIQSQFGLFERQTGRSLWLSSRDFESRQQYIDDTNVLQTHFTRDSLHFVLTDFVHPASGAIVRSLEIRNNGIDPVELGLFHMEASSLEENKGDFGHNVAYYNSLESHVVRYRGHPFDNTVEAHACLLIAGSPRQDQLQCGVSYQSEGPAEDAFLDVKDGILRHNAYSSGDSMGATSALLWMRAIPAGRSATIAVYMAGGVTLPEAEQTLESVRAKSPDQLRQETVEYWREWLETGKRRMPALEEERLQTLYARSLLVLKLLQDDQYGSFIAAPTLYPDYRYCWPRDAVYLADTMDRCGYHAEAEKFYRWCRRTQMADGLWYQNHYTDGRRHWPGIQVDQVGTILWGIHRHYLATADREFLVEMWPTVERAAWYVLSRINPDIGLVYSEQDLWEETGGYLTYTNASCVAGLRAAAAIAREIGQDEEATLWPDCAEKLRVAVETKLIQEGIYVGELTPDHPFAVRQDYILDVSNVGLSVPFEVVAPDAPEMVRTVELLEKACDYPIGGVGRYASDLFVGGNPWSLSALWLAMYYARAGRFTEARAHLDWTLRHATSHDFIPEQNDKRTGAPASAMPLGWSHALAIIVLQLLGGVPSERAGPSKARTARPADNHLRVTTPVGARPVRAARKQ